MSKCLSIHVTCGGRLYLRQRKGWFTLIEMLVVVSIIGILASLLMPALMKGIGSARAMSCVNNQKQLSLSMRSYSDNYDGYITPVSAPPFYSWVDLLTPYTLNFASALNAWTRMSRTSKTPWQATPYLCPSADWWWYDVGCTVPSNYTSNVDIMSNGSYSIPYGRYSKIQQPSRSGVLWDGEKNPIDTTCIAPWNAHGLTRSIKYDCTVGWVHNESTNVLFVDGHAESVSWCQMLPIATSVVNFVTLLYK